MSVLAVHSSEKIESQVTFRRVLHSEWIKFWSLKSTWWVLGVTTFLTIGYAAIMAVVIRISVSADSSAPVGSPPMVFHSTDILQGGMTIGPTVMSILGIVFITSEYSSGSIRPTLLAVPRRVPVLMAKAIIVGAVAFIVSFATSWIALVTESPIANGTIRRYGDPAHVNVYTPQALRVTAGLALALALITVFALGIGALIRSTGGSIGIVIGFIYVVQQVLTGLGLNWHWVGTLSKFLPVMAGNALISLGGGSIYGLIQILPWWQGLVTVIAWAGVPMTLAATVLRKRDAK